MSPLFASPLDANELHAGEELPAMRAAGASRALRAGGELPMIRAANPSRSPREREELPAIRAANRSGSAGAAAEPLGRS